VSREEIRYGLMTRPTPSALGVRHAPARKIPAARHQRPTNVDYDAEISKVDEYVEELKPQLNDALAAWLEATAPWVAERWRETLETAIVYSPDAVKALGDEKRKALKERTTSMIDNPRPYVEKRLVEDHPDAWPHLRDSAARRDTDESFITRTDRVGGKNLQTIPDGISSMLNSLLSDMADLLEEEGFNLTRFLPGSPRSRSQRPRVAEGLSLDWSDAMMRRMDTYGQLTMAYAAARKERATVQAQKDRSEAEELWGSA
jgi:hypothetical protein